MRSVPLKAPVIGDMFETIYQLYGLHPHILIYLIVIFHHEMYKQQVTWRVITICCFENGLRQVGWHGATRKRAPQSGLLSQTRDPTSKLSVKCQVGLIHLQWCSWWGCPPHHAWLNSKVQRNKICKKSCGDAKSRVISAVFRAKLGVAMTFNSLVPEQKKRKAWMQFSVWRTITTAPFKVWIIYWYWYLRMDYHQRPGRDTCQSNAILRRNDSSRSACIGRVPRFYVQSSGKCWAPNIAPSRYQK